MPDIVFAGLVALAGVVVGGYIDRSAHVGMWRRQEALEASMHASETYEYIWGDRTHAELTIHLGKLRARLEALAVGEAVIDEFQESALSCWHDSYENRETSPDGEGWIERQKLERFVAAQRAVWNTVRPRHWWAGRSG